MSDINFSMYLSDEEKSEIAKQAFYDAMSERFKDSKDNVVFHFTQEYVMQLVNQVFGADILDLVSQKVIESVKGLSSYEVFRDDSQYLKRSIARRHLNDAMEQAKPEIYRRVAEIINDQEVFYFEDVLKDVISDYVSENLFKKRDSK